MAANRIDVLIVVPPFASAEMPMLGPSLLLAECARRGLIGRVRYSNLKLARLLGYSLYQRLALSSFSIMAGELLFKDFAFPNVRPSSREAFSRFFAGGATISVTAPEQAKITEAEIVFCASKIDSFLRDEGNAIAAEGAGIVGFSSVFQQTLSSIALARRLKSHDRNVVTVLGGANTSAPMGHGLARIAGMPFDYIIGGEADQVFPEFAVRAIRSGELPIEKVIDSPPLIRIDELPYPDYSDYFAEVEALKIAGEDVPELAKCLPIETSRGCWWGAKHHCTFCGLNGTEIAFRAKSANRILEEIESIATRYGVTDFQATDNIMPRFFKDDVLPVLADAPKRYRFFYEVKSNLSDVELDLFVKAGVDAIQPGIESLSSKILKRVDKGVTGLQNIWLLRECASRQIAVVWNILAGIPGDTDEDYSETIRVLPALAHLHPPSSVSQIVIDRYSPYHVRPATYGMSEVAPLDAYGNLYPADAELSEIAYHFSAKYVSAYLSDTKLASDLSAAVHLWKEGWADSREPPKLYGIALDDQRYFIEDTRPSAAVRRRGLTAAETSLLKRLRRPVRRERIDASAELDLLLGAGYVVQHEGCFISVVVEPEIGFRLRH